MNKNTVDRLNVKIFETRSSMGAAAALEAADSLRHTLAKKEHARVILASAPSQDELLEGLVAAREIDWHRVTIFHMDEYVGLSATHPSSFRAYQQSHLLNYVTPRAFHGIRGEADDAEEECFRYERLLTEAPIDLLCMGIGENGHIAFNDPPVADFDDPKTIKVVKLDQACREQQVHDGCFSSVKAVPTHAFTLTCPALMAAYHLICVVPGYLKAAAVSAALNGPISESCPASVLRRHANPSLYLDSESASGL